MDTTNVGETIEKLSHQFGQVGAQLLAAYTQYIQAKGVADLTIAIGAFIVVFVTTGTSYRYWFKWCKAHDDHKHHDEFGVIWACAGLVAIIFCFIGGNYLNIGIYEILAPQGTAIYNILH